MIEQDTIQKLSANVSTTCEVLTGLNEMASSVSTAAQLIHDALVTGGKLLCCGNGGSAADSAHFAAEIAGRYVIERPGFPAINLTGDNSLVTALINDYPADEVFARQVTALGAAGDVLAVFSTSGNSANVLKAVEAAKEKGIRTIAFLGRDGGKCKGMVDAEMIVSADATARIQEAHLLLYHTICEVLDPLLAAKANS